MRSLMKLDWPNIRYWLAFCAAAFFTLMVFSSFGMGGPRGALGWFFFLLFVVAPFAIYVTRRDHLGRYLQYFVLVILSLGAGYTLFVMMFAKV